MSNPMQQAAALAEELVMHIEDLLDDEGANGFELKDQDTDETVGKVMDLKAAMQPQAFYVTLADGTRLRVSVEVA